MERTRNVSEAWAGIGATTLLVGGCLAAVGACAKPPVFATRPSAGESSITHDEWFFAGESGIQLYEECWRPDGEARAVLAIVHGLKDHSARYAEFAAAANAAGYAVCALDLRGHGRSEGMRAWVAYFSEYLEDVDLFMGRVRDRMALRPVFLMGHSMGGAIATLYVLEKKPELAGLILSAAALKVGVSPFKVFGTKIVSGLSPKAGVFQLDVKKFSRDAKTVAATEKDALVYQPAAPARTARELLRAIKTIRKRAGELTLPLLALHGTADVITPPAGSKELVAAAVSKDKTVKLYDGLWHDLLHEPERAKVTADVIAWMDGRLGGTGVPGAGDKKPASKGKAK